MDHYRENNELFLLITKLMFGSKCEPVLKQLMKSAPLALTDFSKTESKLLPEELKVVVSIFHQHELVYSKLDETGNVYYFVNYESLEEKLLLPLLVLLVKQTFPDTAHTLDLLAKFWVVSKVEASSDNQLLEASLLKENLQQLLEAQQRKETKFSPKTLVEEAEVLADLGFVSLESVCNEIKGTMQFFYKINCSVMICVLSTELSLEKLEKHFFPEELAVLAAFDLNNRLFRTDFPSQDGAVLSLCKKHPPLLSISTTEDGEELVLFRRKALWQTYLDIFCRETIRRELDETAATVFFFLSRKTAAVDLIEIADKCFLKDEEVQKVVLCLWKEQFIKLVELSNKTYPVNNQVLYLWAVDRESLYPKMACLLRRSLLKCYKIINEETQSSNKRKVLELSVMEFLKPLLVINAYCRNY